MTYLDFNLVRSIVDPRMSYLGDSSTKRCKYFDWAYLEEAYRTLDAFTMFLDPPGVSKAVQYMVGFASLDLFFDKGEDWF